MQVINHDNGLTVHQYKTNIDGPHLLIFGAIHGDEHAGTIATQKLIKRIDNGDIDIKRGTLTLCSICNPKAYDRDVRYIDVNLNRLFGNTKTRDGYELSLIETLMSLIDDCDYHVDIHSTHVPKDPAFVCSEKTTGETYNFATALEIGNMMLCWGDVYDGEDHSSEGYANHKGKYGVTVECGYHKDETAAKIADKAVYNALDYLNMVPLENKTISTPDTKYMFKKVIPFKEGYEFVKDWVQLDPIKKGEAIFKYADGRFFTADQDCFIAIPFKYAKPGDDFFYIALKL